MRLQLRYTYSDFTNGMTLFLQSTQKYSGLNRFFYHKAFSYSSTWLTLGIFLILMAFSKVIFSISINSWLDFLWWPLLSGFGVIFLVFPVAMRRMVSRHFRQSKISSVPVYIEIDEEGIIEKTEVTHTIARWPAVLKAVHDEQILLLYIDTSFFFAVPRRVLSDSHWQELLALVKDKTQNYNYYAKYTTLTTSPKTP